MYFSVKNDGNLIEEQAKRQNRHVGSVRRNPPVMNECR